MGITASHPAGLENVAGGFGRLARPGRVALAVMAGLMIAGAATAGQNPDPGKLALEKGGCEVCHGPDGKGPGVGPALVPITKDMSEFVAIVRQGIGLMPPVPRDMVDDEEVAAMHRYLKGLDGAAEAPAASAPPTPTPSTGAANASFSSIAASLDRAVRAADTKALEKTSADLSYTLVQIRSNLRDAHIAAGYAGLQHAILNEGGGLDRLRRIVDAISQLQRAVELDDASADAHGLLAVGHAMQLIAMSKPDTVSADRLTTALARAKVRALNSPRVLMFSGIAGTYAPEHVRGGIAAAIGELRRAEELLAKPGAEQAWPKLTRADAAAWLGRALAKSGDKPGARAAYQRALEAEPNFVWVKDVLIPSLQ